MPGVLLISLDFELFWGIRDQRTLASARSTLLGTRESVPAILDAFVKRDIRATWATVGFLFFEDKQSLLSSLPSVRPDYTDRTLSPYLALESVGESEREDPYHFGRSLVVRIRDTPGQEIATHTFSHYYALEAGQNGAAFRHDLRAACAAANSLGIELRSLVFPRNQYNRHYLEICRELGITSVRGNERARMYRARPERAQAPWHRASRLLDSYVNIAGHNTFALDEVGRDGPPYDFSASRFLRPWSARLDFLEQRRVRRIQRSMTYAARRGEVFHLWWHPENFGSNLARNVAALERVLDHYAHLRSTYAMESLAMRDLAERLVTRDAVRDPVVVV